MSEMETRELVRVAKALGDATRFRVLEIIAASGEISCGDLAARLPVAQPTISHHVKVLVDAGLVRARREGQHSIFSPASGSVDRFAAALCEATTTNGFDAGAANRANSGNGARAS